MKSLIVAALMMGTMALSAAAAGTQDFCTAGSRILLDRTVSLEEDLTSYRGTSCETDPGIKVIFDATTAPNGFGITATYQDGTIGAGGAIQIKGLSDDKAAVTAPILIRIERNIFESDAVIYVTGSFPTTSLISIANNRMDVGAPHSLLSNIATNFISAITFGERSVDMLMFNNVHYNIYDNEITVEDRTGAASSYEAYGVYVVSNIYMSTGAGVLVQRNNFTGVSGTRSVAAYLPNYAFMMGNNTLVQILGNNMNLTNGVMFNTPTIVVADKYGCHADYSQNTGRLTPIHESSNAVIIGGMNLTSTSSVEIADNVIENINSGSVTRSTRMFLNGPAHLRDESGLYIWFNTMNTVGGSPQFGFGGTVTVEQTGKLYFVGNRMERQEGLILGLSPISFYAVNLRDEGNIAISQNAFGSTNANNKPVMVSISSAAGSFVRHAGNATLDVCRNTWFGAQLEDETALSAALDSQLAPLATNPAMCPAEITSTTLAPITIPTTTTVVRTTVPEDNAAPAVACSAAAVALVAALLAALVA